MFQQIQTLGLEGIMAKHSQSVYTPGSRATDWLKIKTQKRQEVVIAGFTEPKGGRKYFGALIVGIYKQQELVYIGHVGGGFDDARLENVYTQLQPLIQKTCPFKNKPETNAPPTWVKPILLAEITFSNWTQDGQVRHPIFIGLRNDKPAKEVEKEEHYFAKDSLDKGSKEITIGKQQVVLTNLAKVFWPDEKYTKGDLIEYYREIASIILPHLKDRPESLLRYPNGIAGESFYQKDASRLDVKWLERAIVHSESNNKDIAYLLCQDEAALVYVINLGCIDFNPWSSRIDRLDMPDYLIIDLDPEATSFGQVVKVALEVREVLEKALAYRRRVKEQLKEIVGRGFKGNKGLKRFKGLKRNKRLKGE
jgi:bifunctional non-homologous end joining protein LigD